MAELSSGLGRGRELQEEHGYPALTPALKAKIFGLNAIVPYEIPVEEVLRRADSDTIGQSRQAYRERPDPHFETYGPKTRREFFRLLELTGGRIT